MTEKIITVGLGERSYPIIIRPGLLPDIGPDLKERNIAKRYGVISDDNVAGLYGDALMTSLQQAGIAAEFITFPRGEESKNLQTIATLSSQLARLGFDRKDGLIALGGGVTGDITGFLAEDRHVVRIPLNESLAALHLLPVANGDDGADDHVVHLQLATVFSAYRHGSVLVEHDVAAVFQLD